MIDAHNHLQFSSFDDDRDAVLQRARDVGVTGIVIAGYDDERRLVAAEIAQRPGVVATAGVHPWAVGDELQNALQALETLDWSAFSGVGELGLDWVRAATEGDREVQIDAFRRQLALARALNLPVVLHCVKANDDLAAWLRKDGLPDRGGMVHSFWGSPEQAARFVELGLHLSIGTAITKSQPRRMIRALSDVGLSRLLVETDAPSRPPPGADTDRNEPAYLPCVVDALALVLGTSPQAVAQATEHNARQLFDLRGTLAAAESK